MAIHKWAQTLASGLLRFARNDGAPVFVRSALVFGRRSFLGKGGQHRRERGLVAERVTF